MENLSIDEVLNLHEVMKTLSVDIQLVWAVTCNNLPKVRELVKTKGADVHYGSDSSIRVAASGGHLEILQYLYEEAGADVHAYDDEVVKFAAEGNHYEVVVYLLEHAKCDPDVALNGAASSGHLDIVKYLVESNNINSWEDAYACAKEKEHAQILTYFDEISSK